MDATSANERLVEQMILQGALWSPALIAAFRATPRHRFLDRVFIFQRKHARWREIITRDPGARELEIVYADRAWITRLSRETPPAPVSSSSQPSLMAQMLEELQLRQGLRVLEIGAGTGYNAASLAHVVGPGLVTSLEVDRHVLAEAWDHLRRFAERQVALREGDGRAGCPQAAPFDRILGTASTVDLEPAWLEQLAPNGLLLTPLELGPGLAYLVRGTMRAGVFHGRLTRPAYFLPLRGQGAGEPGRSSETLAAVAMHIQPAPWTGWFGGKNPRLRWPIFAQSLAFYGWLRGLQVHYRVGKTGHALFGLSQGEEACWFGTREWQFTPNGGWELGREHYRSFLDAGGPWPSEFAVRAWPCGDGQAPPAGEFVRRGPLCWQVWSLIQPRERLPTECQPWA